MKRTLQTLFLKTFIFTVLEASELPEIASMMEESSSSSIRTWPCEYQGEDLRYYQRQCVNDIIHFLKQNNQRGYIKMATGTGKTRTFLKLIELLNLKTLIVVPKLTLTDQIKASVEAYAPGLKVHQYDGVKKQSCENILVTTYQSLSKTESSDIFKDIDLVILDEAHSSLSETRVESLNQFNCPVIGFTATDHFDTQRTKGSMRSLTELLPTKIFEYSLTQALEEGFLSPYRIVKLELDEPELMKSLKKRKRQDFLSKDLEKLDVERINKIFPDLIENMCPDEGGLKDKIGLIFTHSKEHAQNIARELNDAFGDEQYAKAIHSGLSTAECEDLIRRHKLGQIKVLVNVDMLTEGYDNHQVFYLIDFRPTKSSLRLLQVFGRLTRKSEDSQHNLEKIYIQLVLQDSGQKVLEEVLRREGVENIKVYGQTQVKPKAKPTKRKINRDRTQQDEGTLSPNEQTSPTPAKRRKNNALRVVNINENEEVTGFNHDVEAENNQRKDIETQDVSSDDEMVVDENNVPVSSSSQDQNMDNPKILCVGYRLYDGERIHNVQAKMQRTSYEKWQEFITLIEGAGEEEDESKARENEAKEKSLLLEVVKDPKSTLIHMYQAACRLETLSFLEESIDSFIKIGFVHMDISRKDKEDFLQFLGEHNLIEKIENLIQGYKNKWDRQKGPQYSLKLEKIKLWQNQLKGLKTFPKDLITSLLVPAYYQGDADAQFKLGNAHFYGESGLAKNEAEAVRLLGLAAAQRHAGAQFNLGELHFHGKCGLAKNEAEAVRLWALSAAQGNAGGQFSLGLAHYNGEGGLAKDEAEAIRLWTLSADQGNVYAKSRLRFKDVCW